ncbi:MAG TPA: nickel pincer cofactor biosynthesis protein LarB [Thermodesulfobacteriaceae bacterium]|nr:nickel pincer cofactor biosynthesis protein LarB [Thermodesulfobacteriaceae bacterium]
MDGKKLRALLNAVSSGELTVEEGLKRLRTFPFEDLGFACLDHHRHVRKGFPEVIYGPGKSSHQLIEIISAFMTRGAPVLVTRLDRSQAREICRELDGMTYHDVARVLTWSDSKSSPEPETRGTIIVVSAGTSDIPVAEEACITLRMMGHPFRRIYDAGVAGVHRILSRTGELQAAGAVITVAGMDGVLPSIVGGLVGVPVIAVPTSTGYGANFHGLAPLLTMLNTCASGVGVVNIDNGFGAASLAAMINSK